MVPALQEKVRKRSPKILVRWLKIKDPCLGIFIIICCLIYSVGYPLNFPVSCIKDPSGFLNIFFKLIWLYSLYFTLNLSSLADSIFLRSCAFSIGNIRKYCFAGNCTKKHSTIYGTREYSTKSFVKEVNILDIKTNETTNYPSIRKAAFALKEDVKSLNSHVKSKSALGLNTLFKNQYLINIVTDKSEGLSNTSSAKGITINIQDLPKNKLVVYNEDKRTLAYVFDNMVEACRTLTPKRCEKFSDSDLEKNKNIQHILRTINKGNLTRTEVGKFYLLKNPGYSISLALVLWGSNLDSTVGSVFTKEERNMIKFPNYQFSVIIGVILSDGAFTSTKRSTNKSLRFMQSLKKSEYVWSLFSILSHYCNRNPYLVERVREGVKTFGLEFYTRSLPCISEIYSLFYPYGVKIIPENIYELLTPVALAHFIMGDGSRRDCGLEICTDCFNITDVAKLINTLKIRYNLDCTLRKKREDQYRIYIRSISMPLLRTIVNPYMHSSMLYKLGLTKES